MSRYIGELLGFRELISRAGILVLHFVYAMSIYIVLALQYLVLPLQR